MLPYQRTDPDPPMALVTAKFWLPNSSEDELYATLDQVEQLLERVSAVGLDLDWEPA